MQDRIERMVIQFRDVLAETERLPAEQLRAYQEQLLGPLILHAHRNVPFYENRLAPLIRGADVDFSRWDQAPVLTRAMAQQSTQALTARTVPPLAGAIKTGETSGSTGRPLRYASNELADIAALGATDRALRWWDFDGEKTMATFVARTQGQASTGDRLTETGWRVGFRGPHHMIPMSTDNDGPLDRLVECRAHYLTAQSFVLPGLAERVRAREIDLRFERINSTSSMLSDEMRDICQDVLGARPIDQYGAREAGLIACECPCCGHYHVNAETILVEILDAQGRPCTPGQTGRVVLTPLYNYAMPLIRYEIGDFAVAGPTSVECPVKLPTLARIMGRYRNSFTRRNGQVIFPHVPVSRLREFVSFAQFQIVQTDYEAIEVRYVPLDPSKLPNTAGLEACVRQSIDARFTVRAVAVDDIPRSASGKFEDYLSLVPRQRQDAGP